MYRENTLANFEAVKSLDLPYLEVDVQLTKDKVAVLYHDMDLSAKTVLKGHVRDYTLAELRASFELTTVEEAILWAKKQGVGLGFELKLQPRVMWEDREVLGQLLVSFIQKHNFACQCFVFGADYALLKQMKQALPSLNLGLIVPHLPADPVALMQEMQAEIYLNWASHLPLSVVKSLQEAGYLVDGSVINDREALHLALDLGLDMIESDVPEILLSYLEENA